MYELPSCSLEMRTNRDEMQIPVAWVEALASLPHVWIARFGWRVAPPFKGNVANGMAGPTPHDVIVTCVCTMTGSEHQPGPFAVHNGEGCAPFPTFLDVLCL